VADLQILKSERVAMLKTISTFFTRLLLATFVGVGIRG
jgi:hypothetical protein